MKAKLIICGLGNPGKEYLFTRHNVGFMFIDYLKSALELENYILNYHDKKEAEIYESRDLNLSLIKPKLFMNRSGEALKSLLHKISTTEKLIIIHDDLDIKFGDYKMQKGKGPKDHNGINSIELALGTKDFFRVRIGIENREMNLSGEKYVLQKFTDEEQEQLISIFGEIKEEILMQS